MYRSKCVVAEADGDISLPEIGEHTDPDIFVKNKIERIFKKNCRPKLMVCVDFLHALDDYFHS